MFNRVQMSLIFMAMTPLSAQTSNHTLLERALKNTLTERFNIPIPEQRRVLQIAAGFLEKHVTLRSDGSASAWHAHGSRRTNVEWKNLNLGRITKPGVTDADKLNGIGGRYHVTLSCAAHRNWDEKTHAWTEWRPSGYILFPPAIVIEERKGELVVMSGRFDQFLPGPHSAVIGKERDSSGLPPGVQPIK